MSDQTNLPQNGANSHNYSTPVPFPPEFDMILSYRNKLRELSRHYSNAEGVAPVNIEQENLALVLDREKVESLLNQDGCKDLVAFFATEANGAEGISGNTIVLMGLDADSKLLPFNNGRFTIAQETWSRLLSARDDEHSENQFREFFRLSSE